MILKSVKIQNYRVYRGPEEFEIASGDKNVTVIQGTNDAGKTTMLNAITWCLYGKERTHKDQELYNSYTFDHSEIYEEIPVIVELKMEDSDGCEVTITRTSTFTKIDNEKCGAPENDFKIIKDNGNNDVFINSPNDYINAHLPVSLKDYFIFDGEQLTEFFSKNNGSIKEDVFNLSQVNLVKKSIDHVKTRLNDFIAEERKKQPKLAKLRKDKLDCEDRLRNNKKELAETKSNITFYENKLNKLMDEFKNYGDNPLEIYEERDKLKNELTQRRKELSYKKIDYKKMLVDNFSKIYGYPILKEITDKGQQLKDDKYIPAPYRKDFLKSLLDDMVCICGKQLTKDSPEYKKIKELYEDTNDITDISEDINKLLGKVEAIMSNYPLNYKDIDDDIDDEILEIEEEISRLETKINEKDSEIKNSASREEIHNLDNEIANIENYKDEEHTKKGRLETKIEDDNSLLVKLKNELKKQSNEQEVINDLKIKIKFCEDVKSSLDFLYDNMVVKIHNKLQDLTTEEFKAYHWKDSYKQIVIDDNFNVKFIKNEGEVSATDPSAGTQLALAYSFITALNNLSGFELPLIVDTPLGRLDDPIRDNLGEYLPKYTKNKQLILLATENEYSGNFKNNILKYVGNSYKLDVIDEEGYDITKVI